MSCESGHNDSSILREFSSQYEEMCAQNKDQAAVIETLQQEVHSLRNRLQVAEKIQAEYQSDLDCQQQQFNDANEMASALSLKLKEEHTIIVKELEEKIHNLEFELREVRKIQAVDKEELLKAKKELKEFQDESPVAALKAELQEIMEEHAANRVACVQHLEFNQVLLKEKAYLTEELNSTREHLEMTEEKMKICKEDMMQQSEALEDLRESLAVAQNELTCLQSGPPSDGKSRGNSLFAEVEDKRQAMLKQTKLLSKKYTEMKKDYGAKCDEISRLRMENLKLRQKWREEAEERDNRDVWLNDNYEIRIKELNKLVDDLRREVKPVFLNGSTEILTYADHLVKESKQEIAKLREEMESRSATRLDEAKALYLARSKVQTLKAEVMVLNAENIVLRDKLDEANITDIPPPGKTLVRIKEVWDNVTQSPKPCHSTNNALESSSPAIEAPESCSAPKDETDSCYLVSEPLESSGSVDKIPETCSTQEPIVCHEGINSAEDTAQSHLQEISGSPVSSNPTSITSCISSIPKPQRLLKMELMEKQQSEGMGNALANSEENPGNSTRGVSLEGHISTNGSSHEKITACKSDIKTENIKQTELLDAFPSHVAHVEEHVKYSTVVSDDLYEQPQFVSSALLKSASPVLDEKKGGVCNEEPLNPPATAEYIDDSIPIFKEPCKVTNENCYKSGMETERPPRQSILTKPSRPSLMPVDQNSMRRVRFADPSNTPEKEEESQTNDQKSPPKTKLTRVRKTYKTKFIVSKELD